MLIMEPAPSPPAPGLPDIAHAVPTRTLLLLSEVNVPFEIAPSPYVMLENTEPVSINLIGADSNTSFTVDQVDLDGFSVKSQAGYGIIEYNGGASFTYTPDTGYIGTDNFTYKVNDGQDDSNVAKVNIRSLTLHLQSRVLWT